MEADLPKATDLVLVIDSRWCRNGRWLTEEEIDEMLNGEEVTDEKDK